MACVDPETLRRFRDVFRHATGGQTPYPYQERLASADVLYELLHAPTGLGKSAAVALGWLFRRRFHPDENTRLTTPRRLVYCLPMRVLVEQTFQNAVRWLRNLGLLDGEAEFEERGRLTGYKPDFREAGKISVQVLMGGEDAGDWELYPERDMILIGTQDMLLSRALNRGYAAGRARWPMQFGLLHTDCLWVFDEIQLMGSGLATTAQLEAFRRLLPERGAERAKTSQGCHSLWMSATLDEKWLETVDFRRFLSNAPRLEFDFESEIASFGLDPQVRRALEVRWNASKPLSCARSAMGDHESLAKEIVETHTGRRGLTLVVINTVRRAQELHWEIEQRLSGESAARLVLLHSRFRPVEREQKINELLDKVLNENMICVSTQVVEAGVDVDATTLFTELAPWASLVQRFGRCNRRGERNELASVRWIDASDDEAAPYETSELRAARKQLRAIGSRSDGEQHVGLRWLPDVQLKHEHTHVIRRRDLVDLFDTTPDLAGNDIDIDRYVREVEETDVRIFWREWGQPKGFESPPDDKAWRRIAREELCPAPVRDFKKEFAKSAKAKGKIWRWNYLDEEWSAADADTIYPGQTYLIHAGAGGYDSDRGWLGTDGKGAVQPPRAAPADEDDPWAWYVRTHVLATRRLGDDAYDDDGLSKTDAWQTIAQHTDEVCREVEAIIAGLALPEKNENVLSAAEREVLRVAARWHDWGKAHVKFQIKIDDGQELATRDENGQPQVRRERSQTWQGCRAIAKAPGERVDRQGREQDPGYWGRITSKDGARRHFRHELASALAVLQKPHDVLTNLSADALNLVAYLIAAHHGKVRVSIRSMPNETRPRDENGNRQPWKRFARGVWDGDKLPGVCLGKDRDGQSITAPDIILSLEPMEIGLCEKEPFEGQPSWLERALRLRDALGPFRLAYLEALLRAADWRASAVHVSLGNGAASHQMATV